MTAAFSTKPPWAVVTPSRITDYRTCPRRYRNAVVLGLHGAPVLSNRQSTGTAVHEALALAHETGCDAEHIAERIAAGANDEVMTGELPAGVDPEEVARLVRAHSALCPSGATFGGAELDLLWWDSDDRILYRGRADAIWFSDDGLEIRDYKTGRRDGTDLALRTDVAAYAALGAVNFGQRPLKVTIEYLADPALDSLEVDEALLATLLESLRAAGRELASASEFPARPGPQCTSCQFRSTCPEAEPG